MENSNSVVSKDSTLTNQDSVVDMTLNSASDSAQLDEMEDDDSNL